MAPPPRPSPPRLFGSDPAEIAAARRADSLRLTWDEVAGADRYEIRIGGGPSAERRPGDLVAGLTPNAAFAIELRALNADGASAWSDPGRFITRPPVPPAPSRLPYDLAGWGIALSWSVDLSFGGGANAAVELHRSIGGQPPTLITRGGAAGAQTDLGDPELRPKEYRLRIIVPDADVPDDLLAGDNLSEMGPPLAASGPFFLGAIAPRLPEDSRRSAAALYPGAARLPDPRRG